MSQASALAALETGNTTAVPPKVDETKVDDSKLKTAEGEVKPATEEKPKEDELRSKRFAELSKKEQRNLQWRQKEEAKLKQREDALKASEEKIKEYEEIRALAKTKPNAAIAKLGTTYQQLTNDILNDGKLTPELVAQDVNEKIEALQKQLKDQAKSYEEREQQAAAQKNKEILENFSANIVSTVKGSADKYPAVNAFDGAPVIYEMIQKRWNDTAGKHLMTIDEAAEMLEKDLDAVIGKVMQSPKYAARFSSSKKEDTKPNSLNKPKTITNELTSSAPSMLSAKTENDRLKRALEKLV
jgi:small-conductance mechanosensitive channel